MAKDIVLATDGSAYSLQAARFIAQSRLLPDGGVVRVLHVAASLPARVSHCVDAATIRDWYKDESAKVLDPTAGILREAGVPYTAEFRIGFAPQEITQYADEVDAHMIVMGAHGRGVLLDAVIGSVAGRVLALTQGPRLLIQRPGDASGGCFRQECRYSVQQARHVPGRLLVAGQAGALVVVQFGARAVAVRGPEVLRVLDRDQCRVPQSGLSGAPPGLPDQPLRQSKAPRPGMDGQVVQVQCVAIRGRPKTAVQRRQAALVRRIGEQIGA